MSSLEPKVIFTAKDFLAVYKPAGLLMHPYKVPTDNGKKRIKEHTFSDWILSKFPETGEIGDDPEMRPGIVHRLDRETSGLILVARTPVGFTHFKHLFQTRDIKKTYQALVWGDLKKEIEVNEPIGIKEGTTRRVVGQGKAMKDASTLFKPLKHFAFDKWDLTLVEALPKTGRTHQIRVHTASLHHPVIGDKVYGWPERDKHLKLKELPLMLHAWKLEFTDPAGKRMSLEADPPASWASVLEVLV